MNTASILRSPDGLPERLPRRLLLTLRLGETPEHLPPPRHARRGGIALAESIDGGPIDRILRHHGEALGAAHLHAPRRATTRFDDIEQISGVARVLRVRVVNDAGLPALVDALSQLHNVERVSVDRCCRMPFDAGQAPSRSAIDPFAARDQIRLAEALGYEPGDPAIVIGLADSGVALGHAELHERLRAGFDTVDLSDAMTGGARLFGDDRGIDTDPSDEVGHGSGCAGIIAALGEAMPTGAGGRCSLTPARVLGTALGANDKRLGIGALTNIDAGMKRLIDLGAKVINMSFGTPASALRPDDPLPHAEIVAYARARGVILVAASGNSGAAERFYPAAHDGVIAVGSVDCDNRPSRFSTRGEHVALCAPGRDILTCGLDGFQHATGTSFASPFVAAICGLMVARAERRAYALGAADCRDLLMRTARPFAQAGVDGCGHGVLDALAALQALDAHIDDAIDADERASTDWENAA